MLGISPVLIPSYSDRDLVFCREDGEPLDPTRISERFAKLVQDAGLPKIRLHDARHTAATLLLAAGEPAKVVSERLGHSGTAITQDLYQHVTPELEQDAAATAGAAVFGDSQVAARMQLVSKTRRKRLG
jgi:integrase